MKTIIAVWNSAGKGKSSSIRQFAKALKRKYPKCVPISPYTDLIKESGDFIWAVKLGDLLIGIVSQGDPRTGLLEKVKPFIEKDYDVIVCSTRTKGEDVEKLVNLAKTEKYKIIWTSTYTYERNDEDIRALLNNLKGEHILGLVESLYFNS